MAAGGYAIGNHITSIEECCAPLRHRDFSTLRTQSGPDAPAQSVGRVARLSGNVRRKRTFLPAPSAGRHIARRAAGRSVTPVGLEQPATSSDFRTVPNFVGGQRLLSGYRAAPLARFLLSGRFAPRLVETVLQYVMGVVRTPAVRQQWLEVCLSRAHVQQYIPEIGPRLQAMTLRSRQDREQHRRSRASVCTPQELPVFALMPSLALTQEVVIRRKR